MGFGGLFGSIWGCREEDTTTVVGGGDWVVVLEMGW